MITRRKLLGFLAAIPFVPKIVEAASVTKDVARVAWHTYTQCDSRCFWDNGVCDVHGPVVAMHLVERVDALYVDGHPVSIGYFPPEVLK